jgi:nucleotide-binding universal stress UspA family protein
MTADAGTRPLQQARPGPGGRVVVGIDDSPGGLAALRCAIGVARSRGAQLVAVRAWALGLPRHGGLRHHAGRSPVVLTFRGTGPGQVARSLTRRAFRDAAGDVPDDLEVTIETPEGNPGPVLTQIASGSDDVLVVGTRPGPSIKRAVHGSVSAYCTAHARCPVTVVTPGAFGRQPGMSRNTVPTSRQARGPGRRARR